MREYDDGKINYVVRNFPLPNHPHPMEATMFRDCATELGLDLDLDAYDASIVDPATQARIQADFEVGQALGVNSIHVPCFGRPLTTKVPVVFIRT